MQLDPAVSPMTLLERKSTRKPIKFKSPGLLLFCLPRLPFVLVGLRWYQPNLS